MNNYIRDLQTAICSGLEHEDTVPFRMDKWNSSQGGGITKVIQKGDVFEKGGVNISSVSGDLPDGVARTLQVKKDYFAACGLSLVIHPLSPRIPTIHMNIRYFETASGRSWFGGGIDLTPYYPHEEDFVYFHQVLYDAVEQVLPGKYRNFKEQCDSYFSLPHRNEMRGIGGVFFDHLDGQNQQHFDLVKAVGESFLSAYLPIVRRRKHESYSEQEKHFQLWRRGRYVEFNLLYDRGTRFGLEWGGRIESILMSMPPVVHFPYDWHPEKESDLFARMMSYYQSKDWLNFTLSNS